MADHLVVIAVEELNHLVEKLFSKGERKEERREQIQDFGRNCFQMGYETGYNVGRERERTEIKKVTQVITLLPLLYLLF